MSRMVLTPVSGSFVPDHQTDGDLERHGVGHAALLALIDVVLQLEPDGVAADIADVAARLVRLAAARAQDFAVAIGIGNQRRAAVAAGLAQVMQPLQLAALALPVADRILDELERRVLAEVADREDRLEHRLEPRVLALARQTVHLQEALVGLFLDLNQVRDGNGRLDLREIDALAVNVLGQAVHVWTSRKSERALRTAPMARPATVVKLVDDCQVRDARCQVPAVNRARPATGNQHPASSAAT